MSSNKSAVTITWNGGEEKAKAVSLASIRRAGKGERALACGVLGLGLGGALPEEVFSALVADWADLPETGKWGVQLMALIGSSRIASHLQKLHLAERGGFDLLAAWNGREVQRRREPSLSGLVALLPSARSPSKTESVSDKAVRFLESQMRLIIWVEKELKKEVPHTYKLSEADLEWYKKKTKP